MIRIVVDYDIVAVPDPIGAIVEVKRRYGKKESAKPESVSVATLDPVDMSGTNLAPKVAMLPGMIEMVMRVVLPTVMPHPLVVAGVHVRGLGMSWLILIRRLLVVALIPATTVSGWWSLRRWRPSARGWNSHCRGTMSWDVPTAYSAAAPLSASSSLSSATPSLRQHCE